jgi:hypothetical protein
VQHGVGGGFGQPADDAGLVRQHRDDPLDDEGWPVHQSGAPRGTAQLTCRPGLGACMGDYEYPSSA